MVYCISRWKEVFEKSDARRASALKWISCPISFNSTGYQDLLESFDGMTAAALYGAWLALCQIAASSPIRGQLSGQKGEPYTPGRLSRLSGLPPELFEKLIPWCVKVGWLVPLESATENAGNTGVPQSSGESPENLRAATGESSNDPGKTPTTGQDRTGHNKTGQDRTGQDTASPARPGPRVQESENAESQSLRGVVADLILDSPDLQELAAVPVDPDAAERHEMQTSVYASLKISDVLSKDPLWWGCVWYRRQLASPSPVLSAGNAAEAAILTALAMSLRKVPDGQVKKNRLAILITLLSARGCGGLAARISPFLADACTAIAARVKARAAAAT